MKARLSLFGLFEYSLDFGLGMDDSRVSEADRGVSLVKNYCGSSVGPVGASLLGDDEFSFAWGRFEFLG